MVVWSRASAFPGDGPFLLPSSSFFEGGAPDTPCSPGSAPTFRVGGLYKVGLT